MKVIITLLFSFLFTVTSSVYGEVIDTSFIFAKTVNSPDEADDLYDVFKDSKGYLFLVYESAVYKYDGKKYKKIEFLNNSFYSLLRAKEFNSKVYIHDFYGQLFYIENDTLKPYPYNHLLVEHNPFHFTVDFRFDKEENLHISFEGSSYIFVSNTGKLSFPFKDKNLLLPGYICYSNEKNEILFISSNSVDFAGKDTFYIVNKNFEVFRKIAINRKDYKEPLSYSALNSKEFYFSTGRGDLIHHKEDSIVKLNTSDIQIRRLFVDHNKDLWISTKKKGVINYSSLDPKIIPKKNVLISTQDHQNSLWGYNPHGELIKVPSLQERIHPGINKNSIVNRKSILTSNENFLLISTNQGSIIKINKEDINGSLFQVLKLPKKLSLKSMVIDASNSVWISGRAKIYFSSFEDNWTEVKLNPKILSFHHRTPTKIYKISYQGKDMIFGTHNRYLFEISQDKISRIFPPFFEDIQSISNYKDSIVIVTSSKVFLTNVRDSQSVFKEIPIPFSANIFSKTIGEHLLICSNGETIYDYHEGKIEKRDLQKETLGVSKIIAVDSNRAYLIGDNWYEIDLRENGEIEFYSTVPSFNSSSFIEDSTNAYWTQEEGLFSIQKNQLDTSEYKPQIADLTILLNGERKNKGELAIPYSFGLLTFIYETVHFQREEVNYRYRVKGYSEEWFYTTTNSINIATLTSNNYVFEVQARSGNKQWSEKKQLFFRVELPFWLENWFLFIVVGLISIGIYFGYVFQLNRVQKQNIMEIEKMQLEQRVLKNQMNPHYIFNIITSLKFLILDMQINKANTFLSMFAIQLRSSLNYSSKNKVSIKEEVKFLKSYMDLENLRLENTLKWEINVQEEELNNMEIPPFLIQPIVENAIQHGLKRKKGIRELKVNIREEEKAFICVEVIDNGVDFEGELKLVNASKKVSATQIILERLKKHNRNNMGFNIIRDKLNSRTIATLIIKKI